MNVTKSIRISEEQESFLLKSFKNVNTGIGECIDIIKSVKETAIDKDSVHESLCILSDIQKQSNDDFKLDQIIRSDIVLQFSLDDEDGYTISERLKILKAEMINKSTD